MKDVLYHRRVVNGYIDDRDESSIEFQSNSGMKGFFFIDISIPFRF